MKYKKHIFFIFLCTCLGSFSEAMSLTATYSLINFGVNQGLPSSEVYDLYQDAKTGILWIATDRGLVKYDGHSFHTLTVNDGLTDNVIIKLTPDKFGNIWCHTTTNRLCYINPEGQIKKYVFNRQLLKLISGRDLKFVSLCYDEKKTLHLMAQHLGGKITIDCNGKASWDYFSNGKEQKSYFVNFLLQKSFYFYTKIPRSEFSYPIQELKFGTIHALAKQKFLLTDGSKIKVYEKNRLRFCLETGKTTIQSGRLNNTFFWVSYLEGGVDFFDGQGKKTGHFLDGEIISDVLQDHEGGIWFSSVSNGIFYLKNLKIKTLHFAERLTSIAAYKNEILIGFYNGSLGKLNTVNMGYLLHKGFQTTPANVHVDQKTQCIYANYPRITAWMRCDFKFPKIFPIGTIKTNESEGLPKTYMGSYVGFAEKSGDKISYKKTGFRITDITMQQNRLLLASYKGLYKYRNDKAIKLKEKALNFRIDDIDPFRNGIICATLGGGCVFYSPDRILVLKKTNGLLSNLNTEVFVENDSTVWLASASGVNKIVFDPKFNYTIYSFTINDGLPSNEVIDIDLVDRHICIATKKGLTFIPRDYLGEVKKRDLFLAFHKMRVNGTEKKIKKAKKVFLQYNQNNLEIFFSAVVFGKKQDLKYRYRLLPSVKKWETSVSKSVHFSSLPPGKYQFQVQACTEIGHWSPPQQLSFVLYPPIWKTAWFLLLVLFVIILSAGLLFRFRLNLKNRRIKLLETEMQVLRTQMNPHFIFNSLASIQYFILEGNTVDSNRYLVKFSRLVRGVLENAKKELISLKKELEILQIYIELEQLRSQNFDFEIIINKLTPEMTYVPPMLIQPFVENSIWHGFNYEQIEKRGNIRIEIERRNNQLICIIEDDGIGRVASEKSLKTQKSFGIEITNTRVQFLQKIYGIETGIKIIDKYNTEGLAEGTRIEMTLPIIESI